MSTLVSLTADVALTTGFGVGLMGFGVFFLLFGILLYFDRVLLAFGNILFISGLPFIIGLRSTFHFFSQRQKLRGSSFLLGGIVLVLLRWPAIGMLCESYGLYLLFRSSLPLVSEFIANIPVLGLIFQLPVVSTMSRRFSEGVKTGEGNLTANQQPLENCVLAR